MTRRENKSKPDEAWEGFEFARGRCTRPAPPRASTPLPCTDPVIQGRPPWLSSSPASPTALATASLGGCSPSPTSRLCPRFLVAMAATRNHRFTMNARYFRV